MPLNVPHLEWERPILGPERGRGRRDRLNCRRPRAPLEGRFELSDGAWRYDCAGNQRGSLRMRHDFDVEIAVAVEEFLGVSDNLPRQVQPCRVAHCFIATRSRQKFPRCW